MISDQDGKDGSQENQGLDFEEEDRLPWLESAEDYDDGGGMNGRVVGFVLLGLILLGLVVGAIYVFQKGGAASQQGDGELIAAPDGDYKEEPEDAGGKTFAGTGDASLAAAEGETRESALAGQDKQAAEGVLVQLGAYSNEATANSGWATLSGRYDYIGQLPKRIVQASVEGATVYRLSAVAPDAATAQSVCSRLKDAGQACLVVQ